VAGLTNACRPIIEVLNPWNTFTIAEACSIVKIITINTFSACLRSIHAV